jgi:hypothetical protein
LFGLPAFNSKLVIFVSECVALSYNVAWELDAVFYNSSLFRPPDQDGLGET